MTAFSEKQLTSCHGAGHVMACMLRDVPVDFVHVDEYYGYVKFAAGDHDSFISFAGLWAEDRAAQDAAPNLELVAEALSRNTSDWQASVRQCGLNLVVQQWTPRRAALKSRRPSDE
jgi:hypothetical protein